MHFPEAETQNVVERSWRGYTLLVNFVDRLPGLIF